MQIKKCKTQKWSRSIEQDFRGMLQMFEDFQSLNLLVIYKTIAWFW